MGSSDKYILIEDSRNLGDDSYNNDDSTTSETEAASEDALKSQGIFIQDTGISADMVSSKPLTEFSKELFDEAGIEIVPSNNKDDYTE
ncbi:MAG: hypothetical protein AAB628_00840 [Patescibacteria group bacterium]